MPEITGVPVIDGPSVLDWPADGKEEGPSLAEPTANLLNDLHAEIGRCDMVLSTSGNYHMALRALWGHYVASFPADDLLCNWLYTTTPPAAERQITCGLVRTGNLVVRCRPQIAVGPRQVVDSLVASGFTEGSPMAVSRSRGNVLLVKNENPKNIRSIWDLGRRDVRVVTPNPVSEPGSFGLYANSIYGIARNDPNPPQGMSADVLYAAIFGGNVDCPGKWLSGRNIHHREVPWSIVYGRGDAAVIFYHIAKYAASTFPDLFDFVPLGGTHETPSPLPGNRTETLYAVRITGEWDEKQRRATEKLMDLFRSAEWAAILERCGLDFP